MNTGYVDHLSVSRGDHTGNGEKRYENQGNRAVVEMLGSLPKEILDVGCGSGDNARMARTLGFDQDFYGITLSPTEQVAAVKVMKQCWVENLEKTDLNFLSGRQFDAILFSHVLEHLKNPADIVERFVPFLRPRGRVIIAVPNVLVLKQRIRFLLGRFDYEEEGIMDSTHLRFYTYDSADRYLVASPELRLVRKEVEGSVPLWFLRHHFLPGPAKAWLDQSGCSLFPNLFGYQILLEAQKTA